MGKRDPRIDAYIREAAPFARPVLSHLRRIVHDAAPGIEETLKWRFPHFVQGGIVCSMAAFKAHCSFGFWKGREVIGSELAQGEDAMGQFGRITRIEDLPPADVLAGWVRKAVELNARGTAPRPAAARRPARPVVVPEPLQRALAGNRRARETFDSMSPSQRREYAEWIADAKQEATRERRIRTALEWIAEGKPRNWKYMSGRDTSGSGKPAAAGKSR
jgi:uncharacterized protein YdeI (YjbR/CyaY-like superfamily)